MTKHRQPDFEDLPTVRTNADRRDEIVEGRLWRGLLGLGAGFAVGVGVCLVGDNTGKWLMGGSLLLTGGSGYYLLRTLIRRRRAGAR